jgi:hypothetical protein
MQRKQACIRVTNVMQDGKLRSGESIQRRESFAIGDDEASGVCDPRLPGNSAVASDAKTLFQCLSPDGRQRRHTEEPSQRGGVGVPVEHKTEHLRHADPRLVLGEATVDWPRTSGRQTA